MSYKDPAATLVAVGGKELQCRILYIPSYRGKKFKLRNG